jgi:indolepyruvate ferredoxin oxidoreductase, beta subunit
MMRQPITILVAALGGEGGGVLAEWLVDTATDAGYFVQSTSIPGVAQRTGATTYYIEIFPLPVAELNGRIPVLSLLPVPGCIDLFVASELLEAVRNVEAGMVSRERTTTIASTVRTLTTAEKMAMGDGRYDDARLNEVARANSRRLCAFDMAAAAAGTAVSSVMLGAIAASGVLPFAREQFEATVGKGGLAVDASLRGFARGWDEVKNAAGKNALKIEAAAVNPPARADRFPSQVLELVETGYQRMLEFQDRDYAELYLERVSRVQEAERQCDPGHAQGLALSRETARFLALWMAFDDIPRVADLKSRAGRFARVRKETGAGANDVVKIFDFFKPTIAEFCAMLPPGLAQPLLAWDRRRQAQGKPALAFALRLPAHGVLGFIALRLLASLRALRRGGSRYAEEQAFIGRWLQAVEYAAAQSWTLANEIALCGRLIKGYGATNARAKANLAHILDHLVAGGTFATAVDRATAIRQAREAALTDEAGKALDLVLASHGAPPRPVKPQPIHWSRKPASDTARAVT